jgi:hypothetical protein
MSKDVCVSRKLLKIVSEFQNNESIELQSLQYFQDSTYRFLQINVDNIIKLITFYPSADAILHTKYCLHVFTNYEKKLYIIQTLHIIIREYAMNSC